MKKHKIKKGDPILRLSDLVEKQDYWVDAIGTYQLGNHIVYTGWDIVTYYKVANSSFKKWIYDKKLFKIADAK